MKKVYLILLVFAIAGYLSAQDYSVSTDDSRTNQAFHYSTVQWSPEFLASGEWCPGAFPDLPVVTYYQAAEWLGDTLYVSAPDAGAVTSVINKYTIGGGWTTGVPLPVALVGGTLTRCNGKLYYIGGSTTTINGTAVNTVYEYDPSVGSWTTKAPMPVALAVHGAVCWGDSVIFVIGGPYTGSGTNLDVHYYRIASDTWGTISNSLPSGQGRRTFAIGIYGNKIVMSSGYNTAFLKSTYFGTIGSNASQLTWTAGPDAPTPWTGLSRPGGTSVDKYFFLVGGELGGSPTTWRYGDSTFVMDVSTETWVDVISNIPFRRSNIFHGVAGRIVDDSIRIYVPGGYGSVSGATPGAGTAQFDAVSCGELIFVPVELASFAANVVGDDVNLSWATATETNNYGFEVQRSLNGSSFEAIAYVDGHGTTTQTQFYSFKDKNVPGGTHKYRLKQIDFDGTFEYSNTIEVNINAPDKFTLDQNYPNPFNPTTRISFELAADSKVSLKVFDVLGQEVITLVNEELVAGGHQITFDASGFNSGVYFYRIDASGINGKSYSQVKKMILAK